MRSKAVLRLGLVLAIVMLLYPSGKFVFRAAAPLTVSSAGNSTVSMMAPENRSVDVSDNSWTLLVSGGTVRDDVGRDHLEVSGLPAGLSLRAEKALGSNAIEVIVEGTAEEPVTAVCGLQVVVKASAVEEEVLDARPVSVTIEPGSFNISANALADDTVTIQASAHVNVDPANATWTLQVTRGTVKAVLAAEDVTLTNLPAGLSASLVPGPANSIVINVNGTLPQPLVARVPVVAVVQSTAVREIHAAPAAPLQLMLVPGGPVLLNKEPFGEGQWFSEASFFPRAIPEINAATRYFLRLTFEDRDGNLQLGPTALENLRLSQIYCSGGSQASLVDNEVLNYAQALTGEERTRFLAKYILVKEADRAYLYVPIKMLRPQSVYTIFIQPNIVGYQEGNGNASVSWTITTMAVPIVSGVSLGSVSEDYDENEPIEIYGEYFYSGGAISVEFNDTPAHRVQVKVLDDKVYLRVWLPRGKHRLPPGLYRITVRNAKGYQQVLPGQFSVVPLSSQPIPTDGLRVREEGRQGQVQLPVATGTGQLVVNRNYFQGGEILNYNLDEMMGSSTRERIIIPGSSWNVIAELQAASSWGNITVYGITPAAGFSPGDVKLRLGRPAPTLSSILKGRLGGGRLCSELFELGGEHFQLQSFHLSLPIQSLNYERLRVLRYEEEARNWYDQPFQVNPLDQVVEISGSRPGIFVVLEQEGR